MLYGPGNGTSTDNGTPVYTVLSILKSRLKRMIFYLIVIKCDGRKSGVGKVRILVDVVGCLVHLFERNLVQSNFYNITNVM